MATLMSGAAFGAAMLASGFHHPSIVISQLKFENWHMFQTFITATAASAYVSPPQYQHQTSPDTPPPRAGLSIPSASV